MQHKHKKKGHRRPIVPVHTAAPAAAHKAGNAKSHHNGSKHQQQHAKQQQQQQQQPAKHTAAGSTGKRKLPKDDATQPAKKMHKHEQQQQQQQPLPVQGNGSQQHNQQSKQQQPHHNSKTKVAQQSQKQQRQQQQQPASKQGEQQQSIKQQQQLQQKQQQGVREVKSAAAAAAADQAAGQAAVKHGRKRRGKRQREQATDAAAAKHAKRSDTSTPHTAAAAAAAAAASKKPWHPDQPTAVGSNWQALKQQLAAQDAAKPKRPYKRQQQGQPADAGTGAAAAAAAAAAAVKKQISSIGHNKAATPTVAMDCEMVGVGPGGERDSLARVSIVNAAGNVLFDSFVAQKEAVTDYRTWVSGVTAASLVGAPQPEDVQKAVAELLEGRTLVGHGLSKDLTVLMLSHPRKNIRDTAKYPPFMFSKGGKRRPRALRQLALQELGISIQEGQHSSVDDARAALYLYQKHAATWERALKTPQGLKHLPTANRPAVKKKRVESYSIRDVKDDPMADL